MLSFDRGQAETKATNYSAHADVDTASSNKPPLRESSAESDDEDAVLLDPSKQNVAAHKDSTFAAKAIPAENPGSRDNADLAGGLTPAEQTCQEAVSDFVLAIQRAMARLGLPNVTKAEDVVRYGTVRAATGES